MSEFLHTIIERLLSGLKLKSEGIAGVENYFLLSILIGRIVITIFKWGDGYDAKLEWLETYVQAGKSSKTSILPRVGPINSTIRLGATFG